MLGLRVERSHPLSPFRIEFFLRWRIYETKDALRRVIDSRLESSNSRLCLHVVVCITQFRTVRIVSVYYYSFTSGFYFDFD